MQLNGTHSFCFMLTILIHLFDAITTVTNQHSIHEEIKSRLKSGNACCHSMQNVLSSSLLSKNINTRIKI